MRCHNELGVCLPYVNKPLRIRRTTLGDQAFVLRKRADEMAERARLLYVAMTRARERLLLFASPKDMTRGLWFAPQGDYRVWQGQSMLDWVMCALMDEPALRAEYARQLTEEGKPGAAAFHSFHRLSTARNPLENQGLRRMFSTACAKKQSYPQPFYTA